MLQRCCDLLSKNSKLKIWINAISFYIGWFVVVYAAETDHSNIGSIILLFIVASNIIFLTANIKGEIIAALIILCIGSLLDSIPCHLGYVQYAHGATLFPLYPMWVSLLWALLSLSLGLSLGALNNSILLQSVAGFFGGPLGFLAARRMEAMVFLVESWKVIALYAVLWGVLLPLSCFVRKKAVG